MMGQDATKPAAEGTPLRGRWRTLAAAGVAIVAAVLALQQVIAWTLDQASVSAIANTQYTAPEPSADAVFESSQSAMLLDMARNMNPEAIADQGKPSFMMPPIPEGTPIADYTLIDINDGQPVRLADLYRDKPAVLLLSSFTCNVFCREMGRLEELSTKYGGRANFLIVAIRDANHDVVGARPVTKGMTEAERLQMLAESYKGLNLKIPAVADTPANSMEKDLKAWPQRMVVVDCQGQVAIDAVRDSQRLENWLEAHLPADSEQPQPRLGVLLQHQPELVGS